MAEGILTMLTSDRIRCRVPARSRDEVLRLTGELLERAGLTEPQYTVAMAEVVDELGPYMVIAPGVALPHARPERGVRKAGLVLLTLAEPVPFGQSQNDPVWLAIGLAGTDDHAHENALAEIALVLTVPEAVEAIRSANDADEILAAIRHAKNVEKRLPTNKIAR